MKKKTLQNIIRFLLKTLTVTEYVGIENIPTSGGVIFAINHLSYMDTPLMLVNPVRTDITALVTNKYQDSAFISWFTNAAEGIWIDRDIADFSAIRKASAVLKRGMALGIAPEGTRSKTGEMQEAKPGTIMLAMKSGAPILPIGITGTEAAFDDLKHFRRPELKAIFGKPFMVPEFEPGERSEGLKKWTEILMVRIAELLPPAYRGYYRGHVEDD